MTIKSIKQYKLLIILCLIFVPLFVLILSSVNHFFIPLYAYLTILGWLISVCVWTNIQDFTKRKLLGVTHAFVIITAIISYISYLLYNALNINEKKNIIYVNDSSSRLIFVAENLIYLAIYLAILLFLIDMFLFFKKRRKKVYNSDYKH